MVVMVVMVAGDWHLVVVLVLVVLVLDGVGRPSANQETPSDDGIVPFLTLFDVSTYSPARLQSFIVVCQKVQRIAKIR
uniref:Putative secreted protein n=1 Tax=Anopheles darlingi TaxID=43151 RepID=A0A2M4DHK3_ANODA